jgi:cardiolipin synthase
VLAVGSVVGAALTNHRVLGPAEARVMVSAALLLLAIGTVAALWPRTVAPVGGDRRLHARR